MFLNTLTSMINFKLRHKLKNCLLLYDDVNVAKSDAWVKGLWNNSATFMRGGRNNSGEIMGSWESLI